MIEYRVEGLEVYYSGENEKKKKKKKKIYVFLAWRFKTYPPLTTLHTLFFKSPKGYIILFVIFLK